MYNNSLFKYYTYNNIMELKEKNYLSKLIDKYQFKRFK